MTDIVERLRALIGTSGVANEAADEIERLKADLEQHLDAHDYDAEKICELDTEVERLKEGWDDAIKISNGFYADTVALRARIAEFEAKDWDLENDALLRQNDVLRAELDDYRGAADIIAKQDSRIAELEASHKEDVFSNLKMQDRIAELEGALNMIIGMLSMDRGASVSETKWSVAVARAALLEGKPK